MQSYIRVGLLVAAVAVLGAVSARAETLEVTVPFQFVVQGHTLPAGQYRVTSGSGLVQIRGERGNDAALTVLTVPTISHDPAGTGPSLVFSEVEHQHRLDGIWDGTHGFEPVNR
jgi:hypothetical protein